MQPAGPRPRPRRRARRGDGPALRGQILAAARDLLEETGSEDAVSIRSVAARVGVSTPSIYLHFADKAQLIDAVCEAVFAELDEQMMAASATADDPLEALRRFGLQYVAFAQAHPEQYRILMMSRRDREAPGDHADFPAFVHLLELVERCQAAGIFDDAIAREQIGMVLWAAAHGAASLSVSKPEAVAATGAADLAERLVSAIGAGLAVLIPGTAAPRPTGAAACDGPGESGAKGRKVGRVRRA